MKKKSTHFPLALKMGEMQNQAVLELIELTGVSSLLNETKTVSRAREVLQKLQEKGYNISELPSGNALKTTYVLEYDGKIIACRDVCINVIIEEVQKNEKM
jgi:hypothetical protein